MSDTWIPWPARIAEFAPVVAVHPLDWYFPSSIESFLEQSCGMQVWMGNAPDDAIPDTLPHGSFPTSTLTQKVQWMNHPKANHRWSYLDRHDGVTDMKKSRDIQNLYRPRVYAHGQRKKGSKEAYIIFYFFYVENFAPRTQDPQRLKSSMESDPTKWWTHEGDWESVSLHFERHDREPDYAYFSRHAGFGQRMWSLANKWNSRLLVYSALGSHASYNEVLSKKLYPQSRVDLFFDYYDVTSDGRHLHPSPAAAPADSTYDLVVLDPRLAHLWLNFKGGWGKAKNLAWWAGPGGPSGPLSFQKKHFKWRSARNAVLPSTGIAPPGDPVIA